MPAVSLNAAPHGYSSRLQSLLAFDELSTGFLEVFYLFCVFELNIITGEIPASLGQLSDLERLSLAFDRLSSEWCSRRLSSRLALL